MRYSTKTCKSHFQNASRSTNYFSSSYHHRSSSTKATVREYERIDKLFYTYANKSSDAIEPEGIEKLCCDSGISVRDVRILMLAWKMKAERQGYFTLDEWRKGFKAIDVEAIKDLKDALRKLKKKVRESSKFPEFYSYAFQYCLTEEKQKTIDVYSACELLGLILKSQFRPQVDALTEYLKNQKEYKVITMDQWDSFLRFCKEISFPDLSNYDPDLAWPSMVDDFVDWIRDKKTERWNSQHPVLSLGNKFDQFIM